MNFYSYCMERKFIKAAQFLLYIIFLVYSLFTVNSEATDQ